MGKRSKSKAELGMAAGELLIPRVLHQTGPTPLPAWAAAYVQSLKRHHPRWAYRFWTDDDLDAAVRTYCDPELYALYQALPVIQKTDVARCVVLHAHGGVYADTDMEWYGSIETLLAARPRAAVWLAHSPPDLPGQAHGATNYLMASVPGHPFWAAVLSDMRRVLATRGWPWWARTVSLQTPHATGARRLTAGTARAASSTHRGNLGPGENRQPLLRPHPRPHGRYRHAQRGHVTRAFEGDTTQWSSLNGLTKAECAVRRRLGVRGNAFQLPLCLLGLLLLLVLAANSRRARLRARKSKR